MINNLQVHLVEGALCLGKVELESGCAIGGEESASALLSVESSLEEMPRIHDCKYIIKSN